MRARHATDSAARVAALNDLSTKRSRERGVSAVATIVILPLASALLGAYTSEIQQKLGAEAAVVAWLFVIVLFVLLFWRWNPAEKSMLELAVSHEELEEKKSQLEDELEQRKRSIGLLTIQSSYSLSARSTVLNHAARAIAVRADLVHAIKDLADPIIGQAEEIFGLRPNERWSFAVYLYSAAKDELQSVWRERSKDHPSKGLGRVWGRGEGHVGKAFVDQIPYITGDTRGDEARHFSVAPAAKAASYDSTTYISFAAIPIGPILEADSRPYGILVGTSDEPGRFNRENAGILVQIASAIASLLITGKIAIDLLPEEEDGK